MVDLASTTPVAIGGVGGSGTRVVAAALRRAGWYLGDDLNAALDNLWFTLLFKHPAVLLLSDVEVEQLLSIFVARMQGEPQCSDRTARVVRALAARRCEQHDPVWLSERASTLLAAGPGAAGRPWGWKEPNTHVVLGHLAASVPGLRYVHVLRSGLDMALSDNQNQPRMWGPSFGVPYDGSAGSSLRFWCEAQRRVLRAAAAMPGRVLWLRFEDLCASPEHELTRLFEFCGVPDPEQSAASAADEVRPPATLGRGRRHLAEIHPRAEDLELVAELGFPVG